MLVPLEYEDAVLALGKEQFGADWMPCPNPLSHFNFFFAPRLLRQHGIPFSFEVQQPGELILVNGLHQGINIGPNLNFAGDFGSLTFLDHFRGDFLPLHGNMCFSERGLVSRCFCPKQEQFMFTPANIKELEALEM